MSGINVQGFSSRHTVIRLFVWAGIALLSLSAPFAKSPIRAPEISIAGLHSPTYTAQGPQLKCRVRVNNSNAEDLLVSAADIDLSLAEISAAKGRLPERVTIPARSMREVDVVVDLVPAAAGVWMPFFLGGGDFAMPFEVSGVISVDNMDPPAVPFRARGEVAMTKSGIKIRPERKD
jgi:LEA14-like dessication related protein